MFKSLMTKDLNNHRYNDIDLSKRVNIFSGKNNQGKSTIANAIELCLTGYTRGSGDRSSDITEADLIRQGQKKAEAELETDLFTSYWKRTPSSSALVVNDMKELSKTETQEFMSGKLGVSQDVLQTIFKSGKFLSMDSDERKQMLFDLLGLKVTQEKIKKKLMDRGIENGYYIEPIAKKLKEEGIEEAEDYAVQQRRKAKREKDDLEPLLGQEVPEETGYELEMIEEKLQERKDEKDKLLEEKGRLSNPQEDLTKKKANLQAEQEELQDVEPDDSDKSKDFKIKKLNTKIDKLNDQIKTLEEEKKKLDQKMAILKDKMDYQDSIIKKLDNLGGSCVVSDDVACPMQESDVEVVKGEINADKEKLAEEHRSLSSTKGSKTKEINSLEKDKQALQDEIEEIEEHHRQLKRKNEIKQELQEIEASIKKQKKDNERLQEVKEKLEELNQKIKVGQDILEKTQKREKLLKAKDDYVKVQEKIQNWDFVAKALSSKEGSIIDEILNEGLEPVRERIKAMSHLYGAEVELTQDIDIVVDGKKRGLLSDSELWRANIVFQDALAHFAELPFLIVDGVEILDQGNKSSLFKTLTNLEYEDIIILNTVNSGIKPDPAGPDFVQQWWVEEGKVSKVE